MKYSMFLDDIRIAENHYPNKDMVTCRSYDDAVQYVKEHGVPEFISFDHDLGDTREDEKTGYSFAKFLIEYMIDNGISTGFEYYIHSSNPVGSANIDAYLKQGLEYISKK